MTLLRVTKDLSRYYSRRNQLLLEAVFFSLSFALAYLLRFEGHMEQAVFRQFLLWLPLLVLARIAAHFALGIYRRVWRLVSLSDAVAITKSIAVVSAVLIVLRYTLAGGDSLAEWLRIPVSIVVLEGLMSLTFSLGIRALRRLQYSHERKVKPPFPISKRVLLYGAGRAGIMLRKEMENSSSYEVIGFIDDDPLKVGTIINNTRVLGSGKDLEQLASAYQIDEIIISMATASHSTLAKALAKCRHARLTAKIIPSLQEILSGQVQISQLRDPQVEQVLGRESVEVRDFEFVAEPTYRFKRILVTGAGGSIGTELVRQIARLNPSRVAILDKDENSIYELEQELKRCKVNFSVEPQIADVRDLSRLRSLWADFRPQIVFHAAAHKHVPLMELHPCEAILNNVGGTRNVLDMCREYRAERFVFISSDKAVNPANVMGATKRIGEILVQAHQESSGPRVACVRFGNVLGSRGSVVPLFKKQIAEGGPVTVTHPDMERYFMTIREAVQLILCAGTLAKRGEIFVLDMGNPRNILDLAREMILLSGFEPEKDIVTTITGLRPGEKMTEALVSPSERLIQSPLEKLSVIEPQSFNHSAFLSDVNKLLQLARDNDRMAVVDLLRVMGLGYQAAPAKAKAFAAAAAASAPTPSAVGFPLMNTASGARQESTL